MSEQSPANDVAVVRDNIDMAPSQDLDPISPESLNSDSNPGKEGAETVQVDSEPQPLPAPVIEAEVTPAEPAIAEPPPTQSTASVTNEAEATSTEAATSTEEATAPADVANGNAEAEPDAPMDVDENPSKETSAGDIEMAGDDNAMSGDDNAMAGDDNAMAGDDNAMAGDAEQVSEAMETEKSAGVDESVMEEDPEQVNCTPMDDTMKSHQSASNDPFDVVKTTESDQSVAVEGEKNTDNNDEHNSSAEDNADESTVADDSTVVDDGDLHDDTTDAATVNGDARDDAAPEAVDDIEEGKGVDEELELLPDAECELSEADKEQAILAKEAAEQETDEPAPVDATEDHEEESGDKATESRVCDESVAIADDTASELQLSLKGDEIRELNEDEWVEKPCVACKKTQISKYVLLALANDDETALIDKLQYICGMECVTEFRTAHTAYTLTTRKVSITLIIDTPERCQQCDVDKTCKYRIVNDTGLVTYVCADECATAIVESNPEKYVVKKKRYLIEELPMATDEAEHCLQCGETIKCKYIFKHDNNDIFVCESSCVNLLMAEQSDRFRARRHSVRVRDLPRRAVAERLVNTPELEKTASPGGERDKIVARTEEESKQAQMDREASFVRRCTQCFTEINVATRTLVWETMDFCNELCLGQYQTSIGAACTTCQNAVGVPSLGKYCVRFGFHVRQFCTSTCLGVYKKDLKVCSLCQKDIKKKAGRLLAPVGGTFRDFCGKSCMQRYEEICVPKKKLPSRECGVCNNSGPLKIQMIIDSHMHNICSKPCLSAFQFVNNIFPDSCTMCKKYFERKSIDSHTIYENKQTQMFCSKICMNIYIITNRKIAPCAWCKVKKYNFDMIHRAEEENMVFCSLNCLRMCEVSMDAIAQKQQPCDKCGMMSPPQYHLTMSDSSVRNFCTYQCVMSFQSQFSRRPITLGDEVTANNPVPTGLPKRIKPGQELMHSTAKAQLKAVARPIGRPRRQASEQATSTPKISSKSTNNLVISSVTSLAPSTRSGRRGPPSLSALEDGLVPVVELEPLPMAHGSRSSTPTAAISTRTETKTQVVVIPPLPKRVANATTMCRPATATKEVTAKPKQTSVGCQTDSYLNVRMVLPIPVPIYMPTPMHMYSLPVPIPLPIPLPIPVPIFVPTTRNSANGIMKEMKKIQDKMPVDPFEAELLMMAEMVAGDKKKEESDSDTDDDVGAADAGDFGNDGIGENFDIMQMALKMSGDYDEPAVDLESAMTANTITPHSHHGDMSHHQHLLLMEQQQQQQQQLQQLQPMQPAGRKRGPATRNTRTPAKRGRKAQVEPPPPVPEPVREPVEKADANMCLKFTFGVNAWKQWVMTKNADLEKSTLRRKPFKSELLQMTADELNYSLCLFVKEVRKPNGSEYAPDTIYYLVLGIQQYLYENGRIDNIFTDPYYERFTDCLNDVAKKFSVLYNDSQYIVTRVEEEHLWECKQLGAHSPHVLLSTLMFFNTKHFNLTSVDEHMQLSFSHIMKHWKRNPNQGSAKAPGSRNVLLRFYPPQNAQDPTGRKKKVYEQQENEENPLRCPVKLYEFYLSKCPESVKTRNDVFYLLPERSCVPDSPVWYSTQALGKEALSKMLHRVKMVKEINIALLTS